MHKSTELKPLEIVEVFVTVFCFLKDSSQDSQTLLDDFRTCQGYSFLSEFLLKLEKTLPEDSENLEEKESKEANEAMRNLVLLVASLSFCGHTELKSSSVTDIVSSSLFQLASFELPKPENRGSTVRNVHAFQVLQSVFLKATSLQLCGTIMDAVSTIYTSDNANYFLLENQHTLPQCAERIYNKPKVVQEKFFQLVEFLVYHLKFVPCKELISMSLLIKGHSRNRPECCVLAIQTLIGFIKFDQSFKDVFREIGMLEVFISNLKLFLEYLKEREVDPKHRKEDPLLVLVGERVTLILVEILGGSSQNATVFRDSEGTVNTLKLCHYPLSRQGSLTLMKQLILTGGNEDDMTGLLELLPSTSPLDFQYRADVLNATIHCLRESHRSRALFRKVGGFVYVTSVLVSMEGCLDPSEGFGNQEHVFRLLRSIFVCLTVAMRYEPANARYFQLEVAECSNEGVDFFETIRRLGCFSETSEILADLKQPPAEELCQQFNDIFYNDLIKTFDQLRFDERIKLPMFSACVLLRMLYDMALDNYETKSSHASTTDTFKALDNLTTPAKRKSIVTLNLSPIKPEPVIVHSSIVVIMLRLLPHTFYEEHLESSSAFQFQMAEVIKSLLRHEKNQQIMCDAGFISEIFKIGRCVLEDEGHILHVKFQYLLERLAAQKLEPNDLRSFFRLNSPLCCDEKGGGVIPLNRIKTLVSMTTPRDIHIQNNSILPPFIEFNMAPEGFGCLYLPSMAPVSPATSSVVGVTSLAAQESAVIGGIGMGERAFPPQPGLSFSSWFCIDKYSDPRSDPHPVRLLTLVRVFKNGAGQEEHIACLGVGLSARDKALIVSTQETSFPKAGGDWQPDYTGENGARVWFPDLIKEEEWHHLVIVLNRQATKNPSFSLFINGQHISTQRMSYIHSYPGGGSSIQQATTVYGFIGTPPLWRRTSRLCWKQGPCQLYEDLTTAALASLLYRLGPHYLGSLQAPQISTTGEVFPSQIAEEKIIFGLNAVAVTQMTLAKIRRVYSKVDNRSIAKQLGMGTGENATPIRVVHNSASHLLGPARSLGGVVIGYLGVRVFTPQPVSKVIGTIGGCNVLLGIIAMAKDMESLYAGVKALVCVLKSNPFAHYEMESNKGYQILAMLLRKKLTFLNAHILHLIFTLTGTVDSTREVSGIPNTAAFRDVLCDLDLWQDAPAEVEKSLFDHFNELASDTAKGNTRTMRDFNLVDKLLAVLKKTDLSPTTGILMNVIYGLLCTNPRVTDVLSFALFTAATLSPTPNDEKHIKFKEGCTGTEPEEDDEESKVIATRNRCLKVFFSLLYLEDEKVIHTKYCEDVVQVVGFDWVLLFLQGHLHATTILWGLRILLTLLSQPLLLHKFRTGNTNGKWLLKSDIVLQNKMVKALGQSSSKVAKKGIRQDIFTVPGFQQFNWLMPYHIEIREVYFLLMALALGQPVRTLPSDLRLDLDSVWNFIFGTSAANTSYSYLTEKVSLSGDTLVTILCMVRTMLNHETKSPEMLPEWLQEYPVTLTQFLFYLYHNVADFMPVFMRCDVLTALAATLFPTTTSASTSPSGSPLKKDDPLSTHPTRRNVLNFMRVLIVDSLSLQIQGPKSPPIIDLLLDAKPEFTTEAQRGIFQTELLGNVMDHLLAADILIGEGAALPIVPSGNSQHIAPNVFYLASRLVDKMWQGKISKEPEEVYTFVIKLIFQAKRRGEGSLNLEGIYKSLNRTILYMLSRPHSSVASQMTVLEVLHKVTSDRNIIFGAGNHELEFFGCLTYCLLQLSSDKKIPFEGGCGDTIWHTDDFGEKDLNNPDEVHKHQGQNLLSNASTRVWELLYVSKRPALEEVFKCSFGQQNSTPPLSAIRSMIFEHAESLWFNYLENESKATKIPAWEFHSNQLESRIQRITGGLTGGLKRLTSVGSSNSFQKQKKEMEPVVKVDPSPLSKTTVETATLNHIGIVKDVVELSYKNRQQTEHHLLKYVEEEWLETEGRLTNERGLWGPFNESPLTKWMLDMTEGPSRMRKKLVRNNIFYFHYPYRPYDEVEQAVTHSKYKRPTSFDSKVWFEKHHQISMFEREKTEEQKMVELEYDDCDVRVQELKSLPIDEQIRNIGFQGLKNAIVDKGQRDEEETTLDDDTPPAGSEEPQSPKESLSSEPTSPTATTKDASTDETSSDYEAVMRLLENGEKINQMYRCARIQGLDTAEGLLLFGKEHFYVLDGFTLVNGKEVHDIDLIPGTYFEPIIPQVPGQVNRLTHKREVIKLGYDMVKEVHKRRYLLQPIAVEVFCTDGQNQLLSFNKSNRKKVYQKFLSVATSISDNAQQSIAGQKLSANVEQSAGILSSLMGETSVTQRWVRGEITNFQVTAFSSKSHTCLILNAIFL